MSVLSALRAQLLDVRGPFLVPLILLFGGRILLAYLLPLATEDAYITYRYAKNLALGLGPIYNPGERVMGFTSPLWVAWNALGLKFTSDPATWSRAWSVIADAVTLIVGGALLLRRSRAAATCFTFLFAAWPAFAAIAVSGMESSVMVALLVSGSALAGARSVWAGPVLGALALTRPEGAVAAALLTLRASWSARAIGALVASTGWLLLALYFGSGFGQSVSAKLSLYGTPGPLAGRYWWDWVVPFALGAWPGVPETHLLFSCTVLMAPAAVLGARELFRARDDATWLAAAGLVVWAGYAVLGVAYFFWYLEVPLMVYVLLVAVGLPRLVRHPLLYASAIIFTIGLWTLSLQLYRNRASKEGDLATVASFLIEQSAPAQKILLEPIGIIGWYTDLHVLDEVGLVTPWIAKRRLEGPGWMTDVLRSKAPEWFVVRRGVLAEAKAFAGRGVPFRSMAERDSMLSRYRVATVVGEARAENAFLVLRRVSPR